METELSNLKNDIKRVSIIKEESRALNEKVAILNEKLQEAS